MAVVNPPGFLQNAGATHTAEQMRNHFGAYAGGSTASLGMIPRGGVNYARGNGLQVTQSGTPGMSVVVKSGVAVIPGTQGAKQGVYEVLNDADVTLSIAAAHATLNRIDIVCFKVEDTAYSGVTDASSLVVVTGTPAASPVAPAAPNNSITLASVSIVALDTSITNGEITDSREYFIAAGGILPIRSSGQRPGAGTTIPGHMNWNIGAGKYEFTPDGGTSWVDGMPLYKARTTLGGTTASVTFSSVPSNLREIWIAWTARCSTAAGAVNMRMQINGNATAVYNSQVHQASNTTASAAQLLASTSSIIGLLAGNNALAGVFGTGKVDIVGWSSPHSGFLGWNYQSSVMDTAASVFVNNGGGNFTPAGPYTSVTLLPETGSFLTGSDFSLIGIYS
jgi:hypothetical protein